VWGVFKGVMLLNVLGLVLAGHLQFFFQIEAFLRRIRPYAGRHVYVVLHLYVGARTSPKNPSI